MEHFPLGYFIRITCGKNGQSAWRRKFKDHSAEVPEHIPNRCQQHGFGRRGEPSSSSFRSQGHTPLVLELTLLSRCWKWKCGGGKRRRFWRQGSVKKRGERRSSVFVGFS